MKNAILITSVILCLLFVSLQKNYIMIPVRAGPNVIDVPGDHVKIQWAIGNATEGDIIFVHNGIYHENVVIDKSITLIGENKDSTIINGSKTESVIYVKAANNVIIRGFTLRESGSLSYNSSGVLIERSNNCIISDNMILANNNGISLYLSTNNLIKDNIISSNIWGISLYWSSNNVISANTIEKNSNGMSLAFSSDNNIIYNNNFNNTLQVWSYESTNFWSYNGEGNYWSDYFGKDLNGDGIGDVPYVIDKTDQTDNAPLMGRFYEFSITYKGAMHQVTTISNSSISDFQFQVGIETGNKIIRFKPVGNENVTGFCRVMIPTVLMSYPYMVLLGSEEISPTFLDVSNETHTYLYFTYLHRNQTVTIISSERYSELLSIYYELNVTYYNLLNTYNCLLYNYTQLQRNFEQLNASYQYLYELNVTYYNFLADYAKLQEDFNNLTYMYDELVKNFSDLNVRYNGLFNSIVLLLGNYTQLQEDYQELNASYQDHLRSYSENVSNIRNLTYILAAMTAILIIVTVYLSKSAYGGSGMQKVKRFGEA